MAVAARLPALPARQGRGCSVTTAGCRGGTCSRPWARRATVSWTDATDHVRDAFGGFSPRPRSVSPTARSRSGGSTRRSATASRAARTARAWSDDVSRVMMNFDGSQDSVSTLAHELGHAFHNVALADRVRRYSGGCRWRSRRPRRSSARRCSSSTPLRMPADDGERLALLDTHLVGATQTVVDIHSRFLFETRAVRASPPHEPVGRRHEGRDARRAGGGLRRRPASRPPPRVHVGGEGALLHAVLQLAVHVRAAVRHRSVRALRRRSRSASASSYDDLLSTVGMADAATLADALRLRRARRRVLGGEPRGARARTSTTTKASPAGGRVRRTDAGGTP